MPKWLQSLQRSYAAGRAHYGGEAGPPPPEWAQPAGGAEDRNGQYGNFGRPEFEPQMDGPVHPDTQRVAEQAREIEELRATVADLNGDIARLEAKLVADAQRMEALTEAVTQGEAQRVEDAQTMETLTETTAHVHELLNNTLESGRLMIDVLKLPGIRIWLLAKFHPDKYPNANEAQRKAIDDTAALINAACDVAEQKAAPREE